MLADHDFDVDAEVVFCAENFDDASAWLLRGAGPVGDFYVDDYAFQILPVGVDLCFVTDDSVWGFLFLRSRGFCRRDLYHGGHWGPGELRHLHPWRDDDFLRYFLVDGFDVIAAVSVMEDADHGRMRARKRPDDAPFGATVGADGGDIDQHAVPMHGRADGMRRDEDVAGEASLEIGIKRRSFGDHEAKAVAVHGEAADEAGKVA